MTQQPNKSVGYRNVWMFIVTFGLAYVLGSRALDTGSWWQYLGCLAALVWCVGFAVRSFKYHYGKKR